MRNMSFAMTAPQVLAQTKTVTRRIGWGFANEGDIIQPVRKGMGLRKGEKVQKLGPPIQVLSVRHERLDRMLATSSYGQKECALEGFPDLTPGEFVLRFCASHKNCQPGTIVTRIEFCYCEKETTS